MASSPRGWSVLREAAKGGSLARLHTFKVLEMEFHSHPLPSVWSKLFHVADAALFFFFKHQWALVYGESRGANQKHLQNIYREADP